MREIKFRAWNGEEMYYRVVGSNYKDGPVSIVWLENKKEWVNHDGVISQYTGLKDVVGKEIFEGDIILDNSYGKDVGALIGAVVFSSHMGAYVWSNDETALIAESCCTIMVIGNVWENPELIESEG